MENNIIVDISYGNNKRGANDGRLSVIIKYGTWQINGVTGKALCKINLDIPSLNTHIDFVPSHNFCEDFLDKMLNCELQNDQFEFTQPTLDQYRPPQLQSKIKRLYKILDKWREQIKKRPLLL